MKENKLKIKKRPFNINLKIRNPDQIQKFEYVFQKIVELKKRLGEIKEFTELKKTDLVRSGIDLLFNFFQEQDIEILNKLHEQKRSLLMDKLRLIEESDNKW